MIFCLVMKLELYFNDNKNKIVIHPSKTKWFADKMIDKYNLNDLFPENWIEIDY